MNKINSSPREQQSENFNQITTKEHNVKFPVTSEQWVILRKRAMACRMGARQSEYNTKLLITALNDIQIIEGNYEHPKYNDCKEVGISDYRTKIVIPYKDTGKHMTVKLIENHHSELEKIMLKWMIPKRQAVHRLIMTAIRRDYR